MSTDNTIRLADAGHEASGFDSQSASNDAPGVRTLPYNIEAEKALLGAIITDNRAFERVGEFLQSEHFAIPEHGRIFEACLILIDRGQMANNAS